MDANLIAQLGFGAASLLVTLRWVVPELRGMRREITELRVSLAGRRRQSPRRRRAAPSVEAPPDRAPALAVIRHDGRPDSGH